MTIADWHPQIKPLLESDSMHALKQFLKTQKSHKKTIFPPTEHWFNAFDLTPFDDLNVVILGQDPYHGAGQAQGLSFSVPSHVKIPPSLRNIFKELRADLNIVHHETGDLTCWATQGVLLLNSVLTVEENRAASHANQGWEDFTDGIIRLISLQKSHVVFMLWGGYAKRKIPLIDANKHLILHAAHPSPFAAYRGFFGCQHFSKTNAYLRQNQRTPINW